MPDSEKFDPHYPQYIYLLDFVCVCVLRNLLLLPSLNAEPILTSFGLCTPPCVAAASLYSCLFHHHSLPPPPWFISSPCSGSVTDPNPQPYHGRQPYWGCDSCVGPSMDAAMLGPPHDFKAKVFKE